MKEKWRKRNARQIWILPLLEYLTTSLFFRHYFSSYGFCKLCGFCSGHCSKLTMSPYVFLLHSDPCNRRTTFRVLAARAVGRRLLLSPSLPCSPHDFYSNFQMTINPSMWFIDVTCGCQSYGSASRLLYLFSWVIWSLLISLRDKFFLPHGYHLIYH